MPLNEDAICEILSFAEFGEYPEDLLTFDEYKNHPRRLTGFKVGEPADQGLTNTALRQASIMVQGLGWFVANYGTDIKQDFNTDQVQEGLIKALKAIINSEIVLQVIPNIQNIVNASVESIAGGRLPIGVLVPFTKPIAQIPSGWAIADGTNGTIDMRDRFVIGAGNTYTPNEIGGSSVLNAITEATQLTVDQLPSHSHNLTSGYLSGENIPETEISMGFLEGGNVTSIETTGSVGSNEGHSHSIVSQPNLPPYISLIWIQKISNSADAGDNTINVPAGTVMPFFNVTLGGDDNQHPIFWGQSEPDLGWMVCDGRTAPDGTVLPDLRNKFIYGAVDTADANTIGGNSSTNISITGTTGATTLSTAQMPSHNHTLVSDLRYHEHLLTAGNLGGIGISVDGSGNTRDHITNLTGGSNSHTHSFNITSNNASILPPFYRLIYCVKLK